MLWKPTKSVEKCLYISGQKQTRVFYCFWGDAACSTLHHRIKTKPSSTITCQLWHTRAWLLHHVKPSNDLNETVSIHSSWSSNSTHAAFSPPEALFSHTEVNFQRVQLRWVCLQLNMCKRPHYGGPCRSDGAHVGGKTYESHFHTVYAAVSDSNPKTLVA